MNDSMIQWNAQYTRIQLHAPCRNRSAMQNNSSCFENFHCAYWRA